MAELRIYDNGGKTFDRYTVLIPNIRTDSGECYYEILGLSENPNHALGFNQFCGDWKGGPTRHLGKKIRFVDLPEEIKKAIVMRILQ